MKKTLTWKSFAHHIGYNWWKYVMIAVASCFAVLILYDTHEYKVPDDRKLDLYVYGYTNESALKEYLEAVRIGNFPELEQINIVTLLADDTYGPVQLVTYLAAQEGDIYILPREEFLNLSSGNAFIPLEEETELMSVLSDTDLQRGWRRNTETGESHLCGIPQSALPGLLQYVYTTDMNGFICVPYSNDNKDTALKLLCIVCRDMLVSVPAADTSSP